MDSQWKKAIGVVKDVASIGFAKLNSPLGFIDIAVVKATQHNDIPPKEKHVLAALVATNSYLSRQHLKHVVKERLRRTTNWMVALKTLALIHRLMTDAHSCIFIEEEEIQQSSHAPLLAFMSLQFQDRSCHLASDCSVWVRKYSSYLDQRFRCNRNFYYDILSERHHQTTTNLDVDYIFIGLPSLQQLLDCLLNCTLQGSCVMMNSLIQYAVHLLVKESRNIYGIINHCIRKLVDSFKAGGMPEYKVVKLMNIYRRFYDQCGRLSEFFKNCRLLSSCDKIDLPRVEKPSELCLAEMENYVLKCAIHTYAKELATMAEETLHTKATQLTLDCSIINPSASYQHESTMDQLPPDVSFDGTDGDVVKSEYEIHPSVTDDMPSMLQLPSIEMEFNTHLVQELAIDEQQQQMASARCYH